MITIMSFDNPKIWFLRLLVANNQLTLSSETNLVFVPGQPEISDQRPYLIISNWHPKLKLLIQQDRSIFDDLRAKYLEAQLTIFEIFHKITECLRRSFQIQLKVYFGITRRQDQSTGPEWAKDIIKRVLLIIHKQGTCCTWDVRMP